MKSMYGCQGFVKKKFSGQEAPCHNRPTLFVRWNDTEYQMCEKCVRRIQRNTVSDFQIIGELKNSVSIEETI